MRTSTTANMTNDPQAGPSIAYTIYYPAPPQLPPPPIQKPVILCSDSLSRELSNRYKEQPISKRVRFVYTVNQADAMAKRLVQDSLGLQDSRTVVLPFHVEIGMGQRVDIDDGSGTLFKGSVYGIEINQTGRLATKTLVLKKEVL